MANEEREPELGTPNNGWKPVLGLNEEGAARPARPSLAGTLFDQPEPAELLDLTVIVPARNEQDLLADCLRSLVAQSQTGFELGKHWELVVVDDHSTDRTAEVARSFPGVELLPAAKLERGWTGKNNALWTAARRARGRWLLFTDADTVHEPNSLHHALHEAQRNQAGMLSYAPRMTGCGRIQRLLMPLIQCEMALAYTPAKVSDPNSRLAAACGQFLLIERETYRQLGGHPAVAENLLEDVALAFLAKRRRVGLHYRYAGEIVAERAYRSWPEMVEGWTKTLALFFNNTLALSIWRAIDFFLLFGLPALTVLLWHSRLYAHSPQWFSAGLVMGALWVRTLFRFYVRAAKSRAPFLDCLLSPLALPLMIGLLYRSWFQHRCIKRVAWKGRTYAP